MFWNLNWLYIALVSVGFSSMPGGPGSIGHDATTRTMVASDSSQVVSTRTGSSPEAFDSDRAPFGLTVGGEDIPFRVMAAYALPGEDVAIQVTSVDSGFDVRPTAGALRSLGNGRWTLRAPLVPGAYPLQIGPRNGASVTVNLFVLVPYSQMNHGILEGYRIGEYPLTGTRAGGFFDRPRGFLRVTAADDSLQMSPHFRLKQFVCKEGTSYPKYVIVQSTLLVKLERLMQTAHEHGVQAETFHLMSAYRTPVYNKGIGNPTTFSRHQYGDAADIFVDEKPADGVMDDINHDGKVDRRDAETLRGWAEALDRNPADGVQVGGLSAYSPTEAHGPFVHVDARGYSARW